MKFRYLMRTVKKNNPKKAIIVIIATILIIFLLIMFITKKVEPTLLTLCEAKAKTIALQVTNEVVNNNLKDIKYENLVETEKDNNGKIIAINADVMEMNRLSTLISTQVQEKLNEIESSKVKLALGTFTGSNILSAMGPDITVRIIPIGNVETNFKSGFISAGINQTSHKIYLEVKSTVRVVAPFVSKASEYINDVLVAETILIGDVPNTYYNINGVKDLQTKDMMDIIQ